MSKKLYVGNLSYRTNDEGLREYFSQAGKVISANVIMDKMSGRSRGFGFVEMENDAEAENAIATFHGKEFEGRNLVVNESKPREDKPRGFGRQRNFDR